MSMLCFSGAAPLHSFKVVTSRNVFFNSEDSTIQLAGLLSFVVRVLRQLPVASGQSEWTPRFCAGAHTLISKVGGGWCADSEGEYRRGGASSPGSVRALYCCACCVHLSFATAAA